MNCPYCERPYLRVERAGKVHILVTHTDNCPITDAEDKKLKRIAKTH